MLDLISGDGEAGLSVFHVETPEEAEEVAVRFALTCRKRPAHLDYVVFPDELAKDLGLSVDHIPDDKLDPYLGSRHHEIIGLDANKARMLAIRILAKEDRWVERVKERDLTEKGRACLRCDPGLSDYLKGEWPTKLGSRTGNPASGV